MKKIFILISMAIVALCMPSKSYSQKGEATFGVETGYTTKNNSAVVDLFFQYGLSNSLRIAPDLGYTFRHEAVDAFTANINFHYPMALNQTKMELYPLAGLNYSSFNLHNVSLGDTDDVSTRKSKFGVNVGAGFQLKASESLKLKLEAKYTFVSHYSTFILGIGIGYIF